MSEEDVCTPLILPEEAVPQDARQCECCELYKQGTRMVWGEGNPQAPIMMILDNPGAREDRAGQSFICGTRQTLQQGIREAGLTLDLIYVTYLLKRRPIRAYDKLVVRQSCLQHLHAQIETKKPLLLMGFGQVVQETLFPEQAEGDRHRSKAEWLVYQSIPITFSYHPLAVRRRPNLRRRFLEDLRRLSDRYQQC